MQDFFFVKTNGDYTRVNYSDIIYIESIDNYVRIITAKKLFIVLATMKHVEAILPKDKFCRIHRSYLVSLNHIDCFSSRYVKLGDSKLPISQQYRDNLAGKLVILAPESRNKINFSKN